MKLGNVYDQKEKHHKNIQVYILFQCLGHYFEILGKK